MDYTTAAVTLLHPVYRHWCHSLLDCEEFGQLEMLIALTHYCRTQFTDPDGAAPPSVFGKKKSKGTPSPLRHPEEAQRKGGSARFSESIPSLPPTIPTSSSSTEEEEDEEKVLRQMEEEEEEEEDRIWMRKGMDPMQAAMAKAAASARKLPSDHALLLHAALPLLRSLRPAPVLAVVSMMYHCAPVSFLLAYTIAPLLRILRFYPEVKETVLLFLCHISEVVSVPPPPPPAWQETNESQPEEETDVSMLVQSHAAAREPTARRTGEEKKELKKEKQRRRRAVVWEGIHRKALRQSLAPDCGLFFLHPDDSTSVTRLKLFLLTRLFCVSTSRMILEEYQRYLSHQCLPTRKWNLNRTMSWQKKEPQAYRSSSPSEIPDGGGASCLYESTRAGLEVGMDEEEGDRCDGAGSRRNGAVHAVVRSLAYIALDTQQEEEDDEEGEKEGLSHSTKRKRNKKKAHTKKHRHARESARRGKAEEEENGTPWSSSSSGAEAFASLPWVLRQLAIVRLVVPVLARTRDVGVAEEVVFLLSLLIRSARDMERNTVHEGEHSRRTRREKGEGAASHRPRFSSTTLQSVPASSMLPLRKELAVVVLQLVREVLGYFQYGAIGARWGPALLAKVNATSHGPSSSSSSSTMAKETNDANDANDPGRSAPPIRSTSCPLPPSPSPPPSTISLLLLSPSFLYRADILSHVLWMMGEALEWDWRIASMAPDVFRVCVREWAAGGWATVEEEREGGMREGLTSGEGPATVKREILYLGVKVWCRMAHPMGLRPCETETGEEEEEKRKDPAETETGEEKEEKGSSTLTRAPLPLQFEALLRFALEMGLREALVEVQEEARILLAMVKDREGIERKPTSFSSDEETTVDAASAVDGKTTPSTPVTNDTRCETRRKRTPHRTSGEWFRRIKRVLLGQTSWAAEEEDEEARAMAVSPLLPSAAPELSNPFTVRAFPGLYGSNTVAASFPLPGSPATTATAAAASVWAKKIMDPTTGAVYRENTIHGRGIQMMGSASHSCRTIEELMVAPYYGLLHDPPLLPPPPPPSSSFFPSCFALRPPPEWDCAPSLVLPPWRHPLLPPSDPSIRDPVLRKKSILSARSERYAMQDGVSTPRDTSTSYHSGTTSSSGGSSQESSRDTSSSRRGSSTMTTSESRSSSQRSSESSSISTPTARRRGERRENTKKAARISSPSSFYASSSSSSSSSSLLASKRRRKKGGGGTEETRLTSNKKTTALSVGQRNPSRRKQMGSEEDSSSEENDFYTATTTSTTPSSSASSYASTATLSSSSR